MVDRIERLLGRVPGYEAYSKKESMRDDDRRLREQIAARLDQAVADLSRVSSRLAADRNLSAIGAVENLVRDVRHLGDRVRTASYGYSGLFSDRKVDEFALAQLKAFDVAFDARVETLVEQIATIGDPGATMDTQIRNVSTRVDALDTLFSARNDVITTASPTSDPNVLSLLEPPVTLSPKEEQLLRVQSGGTVSILGDNFQVRGHVTVRNRNDEVMLSLLHLDDGPEWLAVLRNSAVRCLRMKETSSDVPLTSGTDGNASVSGPRGTQEDLPAKYDVQESSGEGSVSTTIRLALGGDSRAYSGTEVPLIDIEVYSEGTNA